MSSGPTRVSRRTGSSGTGPDSPAEVRVAASKKSLWRPVWIARKIA